MDCIAVNKRNWIWDLIGPLLSLAVVSLLVAWLVLTYRARLLQAWETRHIKALKRRFACQHAHEPSIASSCMLAVCTCMALAFGFAVGV